MGPCTLRGPPANGRLGAARSTSAASPDVVAHWRHVRPASGAWLLREHRAGERFTIESLGCELAVDEIYLKVFEPEGA